MNLKQNIKRKIIYNIMIIHIEGLSGSGKTTLGKKLSRQLNVGLIDIDDIHHLNGLKIIQKEKNIDISFSCQISQDRSNEWSSFNEKIFKEYNDELLKINQVELNEKLRDYKEKNIIITGCLHNMAITVDKGYVIKLDDEIRYKYHNNRTLEGIHENYDEIKEILDSNISLYKKHLIIAIKYKVPSNFMPPVQYFHNKLHTAETISNELGYKLASQTEIFNEIEKILKSSFQ